MLEKEITTPKSQEAVVTVAMLENLYLVQDIGGGDIKGYEATFKVVLKREGKTVGIIGGLNLYKAEDVKERVMMDSLYQDLEVTAEVKYEGVK